MPKWQFQARFRRGSYGYRASRLAIARIGEALSEIKSVARTDPIFAAEGAIALVQRLSPALESVDSSSGALGSAVNGALDVLVALIASAEVDNVRRRAWLEQLWEAFISDDIPYLELLGDLWGELCATPAIAAEWADRLAPTVLDSFMRDGANGGGYFHGTMACFSAMIVAGKYQGVIDLVERARFAWWSYRVWGFRALAAQGKRAEALRYAEASRGRTGNSDVSIARACERLLLESGMAEEAYRRYAIAASVNETTYLARFRALAKKYPWMAQSALLRDLVAATPGSEGKWFAAAKSAGLYDEAIALAQATPCDPKTLGRAARDFAAKEPRFALEASLAALRWLCEGYGYEITNFDVLDIYRNGLLAAEHLNQTDEFTSRADKYISAGDKFVRDSLKYVAGK